MVGEMKRILVTGGAGFIGSNFLHLLLQGEGDFQVFNLDRLTYAGNLLNLCSVEDDPRYRFIEGDICDQKLVTEIFQSQEIDTVVHFAAESHVDRSIMGPGEFIQTNVVGTFTLLEAARQMWPEGKGRFIHISTDEVYGSLGEIGLFSEATAYDPRSPYSASKASSDHLASAYFHTYGLQVIITNCSNNYGPYQFPEKLIPLIIQNALSGKALPVYGDGMNIRDWLYVEDHAKALLRVLEAGEFGETYNIGGNNERTNLDVVHTICDLLDEMTEPLEAGGNRRDLIQFVKDRPGHDRRYAIDATKIKNELGWDPSVDFAQGIRNTIQWYLDQDEWTKAVLDGSYRDYYSKMYEGR